VGRRSGSGRFQEERNLYSPPDVSALYRADYAALAAAFVACWQHGANYADLAAARSLLTTLR